MRRRIGLGFGLGFGLGGLRWRSAVQVGGRSLGARVIRTVGFP